MMSVILRTQVISFCQAYCPTFGVRLRVDTNQAEVGITLIVGVMICHKRLDRVLLAVTHRRREILNDARTDAAFRCVAWCVLKSQSGCYLSVERLPTRLQPCLLYPGRQKVAKIKIRMTQRMTGKLPWRRKQVLNPISYLRL